MRRLMCHLSVITLTALTLGWSPPAGAAKLSLLTNPNHNGAALAANAGRLPLMIAAMDNDESGIHRLCSQGADPNAGFDTDESYKLSESELADFREALSITRIPGAGEGGGWEITVNKRTARFLSTVTIRSRPVSFFEVEPWRRLPTEYIVVLEDFPSGLPIAIAAEHGCLEAIIALEAEGADIDRPSADGRTPLMYAALHGRTGAIDLLLKKGADLAAADPDGLTAAHWAAAGGDRAALEFFLNQGVSVDARGSSGQTLLMMACANDRVAALEFLLGRGAKIDCRDNSGLDAMIYAATGGAPGAIGFLSSHGVDVNAIDSGGRVPLMHAAAAGEEAAARELIRRGAVKDMRDEEGKTALMHAAVKGREDMIEYLISAGASHRLCDHDGHTARDMAETAGNGECVRMLRWLNLIRLEARIGIHFSRLSHRGQKRAKGGEVAAGISLRLTRCLTLLNEAAYTIRDSKIGDKSIDLPPIPDVDPSSYSEKDFFEFGILELRPTLRFDLPPQLRNHFYLLGGVDIDRLIAADLMHSGGGSGTGSATNIEAAVNKTSVGWRIGAGVAFQTDGGTFFMFESQYSRKITDAFVDWTGPLDSFALLLAIGR